MHGPMDVGVLTGLISNQSIQNRLWHLSAGGIVQISERLAVDRDLQNGEISPDTRKIEGGGCSRVDYRLE